MTKATKTTTTKTIAAESSVTKAATPVLEVTPAVKQKRSSKKETASTTSDETITNETNEIVSAMTIENVSAEPEVNPEAALLEQSSEFIGRLQTLCSTVSTMKSEFRALEKKWARELRAAAKLNSKRKRKCGNRAPSGFVKPTRISDELASFLGKEKGSEMARTSVTRDINAYIRSNNLQDKENGRQINPDQKLSALLKLGSTDILTYFNLQRFMSPHFEKSVKATAAAAAANATA